MAHGVKPYGRTEAQNTIFGVQDMGELAARLKSIVTHDRRGDVVWLDDFESGIDNFYHAEWFAADTVTWDPTTARSGSFNCRLHVSNAANAECLIGRFLGYPVLGRFGLEFSFATPDITQYIYAYMYLDDGTNIYTAQVRYRPDTGELAVSDVGGVYQVIDANRAIYRSEHAWNTVKLVVDWVNIRYTRLVFNEQVYDISAYEPQGVAPTIAPNLFIALYAAYRVAGVTDTYFDDIIVTQNEP